MPFIVNKQYLRPMHRMPLELLPVFFNTVPLCHCFRCMSEYTFWNVVMVEEGKHLQHKHCTRCCLCIVTLTCLQSPGLNLFHGEFPCPINCLTISRCSFERRIIQ